MNSSNLRSPLSSNLETPFSSQSHEIVYAKFVGEFSGDGKLSTNKLRKVIKMEGE